MEKSSLLNEISVINKPDIETGEVPLPQHDLDTSVSSKLSSNKCISTNTSEDLSKSAHYQNSNSENIIPIEKPKEEKVLKNDKKEEISPGKKNLYSWLNKQMKIEMTDGRVLVGIFLCTDRDANVILGSCTEYLNPEVCGFTDEPRILGLVMVPGRHIISIHHDSSDPQLLLMSEEKEPAGV